MPFYNPTEESRKNIEFWLKVTAAIVGLIGAIWFGTKHLTKFDTEQTILAKLVGDTTLDILGDNGAIFKQSDGTEYCRISGRYNLKNIGSFGFYSDEVTFTLWEVPYLDEEVRGEKVVTYSISNRIDNKGGRFPARKVGQETVKVRENFAPKNELQRSFGFIFEIDKSKGAPKHRFDSFYVVEANARAALKPNRDGSASYCAQRDGSFGNLLANIGDPGVCFNKNDLKHSSRTLLCLDPKPATVP
ncbi:MAG: hypothetical protein ABJN65_08080 [Parasphingorhabdus sp.]